MISLTKLRTIDPELEGLTDEEIRSIQQEFYEFGQMLFDDWQEQQFGSKSPVRSLTEYK